MYNEFKLHELYRELSEYHEKYLKKYGVKFFRLKKGDKYTKDALVLIYLYDHFKKPVSKEDLTNFLSEYGERPNDVQQARHLGQQQGWYVISGTRGDLQCEEYNVKHGQYSLISVTKHYPNFTYLKRTDNLSENEWKSLKEKYNYRCATCGSKEGEYNFHYPNKITKLQKGHKDPTQPLDSNNIIPQCEECNRQDRNYFVYNDKGRVVKIANAQFVVKSEKKIKEEMYEFLKRNLNK